MHGPVATKRRKAVSASWETAEVIGGENVKNNFARIEAEELHSIVHGLA